MITEVKSQNVNGDVLITWIDADTDAITYEVWYSINAGEYKILAAVDGELRAYTQVGGDFNNTKYKIRKKMLPLAEPYSALIYSSAILGVETSENNFISDENIIDNDNKIYS